MRGDSSPARWADIHVPILGQLLGRLILCHACKDWEISSGALDALHSLFRFVLRQNRKRSCAGPPPSTRTPLLACLLLSLSAAAPDALQKPP